MKSVLVKKSAVLFMVAAMLLTAGGCNSSVVPAASDEVFTVLQGVDATTLDPGMHAEGPTSNVDRQIFDTLLDQNDEMKIVPSIATEWTAVNETTWEFKLRDDVYFHDGEQLTADDVKFSVERILNPENSSPQISNFKAIKEITAEDQFNITITTDGPYPLLLVRLSALRIVPEHYVQEVGKEQFALQPLGSGPYKFQKWVKDEYVKLEANEDYWQGAPQIKKVMFQPVPEAAARVMALQKGEADLIVNLPPHQVKDLENNAKTAVKTVSSTRFIMLPFTTGNSVVSDVRVRQAINYAIDVDSIIENIFGGKATPSSQPVSSFDLGFHQGLNPYGYQPEKARQLLAEAGYESLKLNMGSPSGRYIMDKEVAEAIKLQLEEAGFEVNLTFEEWGNYATKCLQGALKYDLWLIGWGSSTFDAGSTLNFWLNSSLPTCYYQADSQVNEFLDQTLDIALKTVDEQHRVQLYHQVIEKIYDDAAFVPLYQQEDLYGVSNDINWQPRPDESIRLYQASYK